MLVRRDQAVNSTAQVPPGALVTVRRGRRAQDEEA
jgi:hypothetical protein